MAETQSVEKCGGLKVGDHCRDKEDCCANSHFKTIFYSSDESTSSIGSASSSDSDMLDDASSSSSLSSSPDSHLHRGFSLPMASKLTAKKGLSRYYKGKARTFTSLSDVKSVEDLAKKEIPFVRRGNRTSNWSPKAAILKKNTKGSANCLVSKSFGCPQRRTI